MCSDAFLISTAAAVWEAISGRADGFILGKLREARKKKKKCYKLLYKCHKNCDSQLPPPLIQHVCGSQMCHSEAVIPLEAFSCIY